MKDNKTIKQPYRGHPRNGKTTPEEELEALLHSYYYDFTGNELKATKELLAWSDKRVKEARVEGFDIGYKAAGGDVIPLEYEELKKGEVDE